jgi:glycolate oxidase
MAQSGENTTSYQPVTQKIADALAGIVGPRHVIFGDAQRIEQFSHDEIPDRKYAHAPECVVRPQNACEIAAIMQLANRERIAVTPRGAGSGLSGGAVPIHGGIVLLCDRMNRILDVDPANMMAVVEPGVVTNDINAAIRRHGLFYAGYPMSLETCYIGGNVAENAGGGKAVKYGVTARYVVGLELVTATGRVLTLGGKLVKDRTGYNLIGLMVGSEGTLGIFTKITLKLMPLPKFSADLLVLFESPRAAIDAVPRMMTAGGVIPTSIEFIDRLSAHAACAMLNETIPYQKSGAMLLVTVDGPEESQVCQEYETIGQQCLAAGAQEIYVADNSTTSERVWKIRRTIPEAFAAISPHQANEDLVVPMAQIPQLLEAMAAISNKYGLAIPAYGHAGDGNLHTRIVKSPDWPMEKWEQTLPRVLHELYEATAKLGGRISGEHGIGHKRKKYMPMFVSPQYMDMMRAVKKSLDPKNILNPGKIFDL